MLHQLDISQVLVLDIETVPQYPDYMLLPENLKALWERKTQYQRKEKTPDEFYERAGIWAEFGRIVCISVGIFTGETNSRGLRIKSFCCEKEIDLLQDFIDLLEKQSPKLLLCAHNGKEFDFPYLCRRMLINGLHIPVQLDFAGKKPWEVPHIDTMELWKFGDYKSYTSLNLLAAIFGIPTPKDDIDGSQVGEVYWKEQNLQRIVTYCQKDVITTAQLLLKFKLEKLVDDENMVFVA